MQRTARWGGFDLAFQIAKEQLVRFIDALHHILNRLRANQMPVGIASQLLELYHCWHIRKFVLVQSHIPHVSAAGIGYPQGANG
jgi:hypothetical protein